MNAELAFGVAALAVAGTYYAAARAIPSSMLDDVVGSGGLPMVYGAVLAALALMQIVRALVSKRSSTQTAGGVGPNVTAIGTLALGVGYAAVVQWLGYAGSIALLLGATAVHQGAGFSSRVVLVAVCGAAFLWALFVWLLGIPQPPGIWSSF
jgi:putative tricarboxylic transport membrane protein